VKPAKKTPILLLALVVALGCAIVALPVVTSGAPIAQTSARPSPAFFGIAPQTPLTNRDVQYMRAGKIGVVRLPFLWHMIQPTPQRTYDWSSVDPVMETIARNGLRVLPFLFGTPRWLARKEQTLPIDSGRARSAWVAFVKAAVERYGPGGQFWAERAAGGVGPNYLPVIPRPLPIRAWQVWNEANFFYFAFPVSPSRYARLLKLTQPAIKSTDPGAEVILSGLFGDPDETGRRGMDAPDFLDRLYAVPGIKSRFDGVALHPYAFHVEDLEELTEEMREVVIENRDPGARLHITEMGWGSQNDPHIVAFEQGIMGQVRELRGTYRYLIDNRGRLNLKGTYWYSWKDLRGSCNFCDSVGLFRAGTGFRPKPAWRTFVAITGGRTRP
jgi:Beta-galactosidase